MLFETNAFSVFQKEHAQRAFKEQASSYGSIVILLLETSLLPGLDKKESCLNYGHRCYSSRNSYKGVKLRLTDIFIQFQIGKYAV